MVLENVVLAGAVQKMDGHEVWTKFWALLFSETDQSSEYPQVRPLIAHYTSLSVLENFVKKEELWLSNPLFMNDREELKFGIEEGVGAVRFSTELEAALGGKERQDEFFRVFNEKYNLFANEHVLDMYIMCFSEHTKGDDDGQLSMWRGYGNNGNGAAVVFDTGKLNAPDNFPIVLSKVIYGSQSKRIEWISNKVKSVATFLHENEIKTDLLYLLADSLFDRIVLFAAYTKHKGFEEEKEWRLAYIKSRDERGILEPYFSYYNGSKGIEPKMKLDLNKLSVEIKSDFSLSNLLESIILGPSVSSPLAGRSIARMLELVGKPEFTTLLKPSSIPFRTWT